MNSRGIRQPAPSAGLLKKEKKTNQEIGKADGKGKRNGRRAVGSFISEMKIKIRSRTEYRRTENVNLFGGKGA